MWLHLLEDGSAIGGTVFDIFGIIDRVWASALIPSLDHHSVARGNRWLCCITHLVIYGRICFIRRSAPKEKLVSSTLVRNLYNS